MSQATKQNTRPRARDLGLVIGILPPGTNNAITDVPGGRAGHATLNKGDNIRTGVTAILPHGGNLFQEKVAAAIHVGNGFGKLMGSTQVNELGELETPIHLTRTLNLPRVADAVLDRMLALPGNEEVRSINPLVADEPLRRIEVRGNDTVPPLFEAVVEATEEATSKSLLRAVTTSRRNENRVEALPLDKTVGLLRKYGAVP
ncbi:MAG: P1 family peptidase [Acidobacteria bacterium]|nr:P1 family peptidase [Acidobacteriota bacterium]MBI3425009.1 P1 family peptidase [Acidobacteriota bacterium]